MFKHLFRLIWNKKKQNFLLILEIFLSFLGLFAGATFVLYPINNYKIPLGLNDENVWIIDLKTLNNVEDIDSLKTFRQSVKNVMLSMKEVEDVSYSSLNIPFSGHGITMGATHHNKEAWGSVFTTEDNYADILGLKMLEGRWFSDDDNTAKERPAVINATMKEELFPDGNAVGEIIDMKMIGKLKVVGVVNDFKYESEAEIPPPGIFTRVDTINMRERTSMILKVSSAADPAFESRVHKTLSNIMKDADIEIQHLSDMREERNGNMRIPLIIFLIIACFLIINVALGIFGVLWHNIHKRRGEIGLRRAIGATGNDISRQLVTEAVLLATLAVLLGSFFAIQFPLLKVGALPVKNYVIALIFSVVFIYALVIVCAIYPGKQAAAIYPADALHED